ncbi:hypothetical protein, partial [Spirillospora albida]|uniref:hypothetical protein n=1 Tax=Spirillospora albida TaxID=58123 RepID=UPI001B8017BC
LRSTPSTWTGSKQRRSARRSPSVSCPESAGPLSVSFGPQPYLLALDALKEFATRVRGHMI